MEVEEKKAFEKQVREVFQQYDDDKNGNLDKKEFMNFLNDIRKSLTVPPCDEYLFNQIMAVIDKDGSGTIEMEELIDNLEKIFPILCMPTKDQEDYITSAFHDVDIDGSGSLEKAELFLLFNLQADLFNKERCKHWQVDYIINQIDDDGNGIIDLGELLMNYRVICEEIMKNPNKKPDDPSKIKNKSSLVLADESKQKELKEVYNENLYGQPVNNVIKNISKHARTQTRLKKKKVQDELRNYKNDPEMRLDYVNKNSIVHSKILVPFESLLNDGKKEMVENSNRNGGFKRSTTMLPNFMSRNKSSGIFDRKRQSHALKIEDSEDLTMYALKVNDSTPGEDSANDQKVDMANKQSNRAGCRRLSKSIKERLSVTNFGDSGQIPQSNNSENFTKECGLDTSILKKADCMKKRNNFGAKDKNTCILNDILVQLEGDLDIEESYKKAKLLNENSGAIELNLDRCGGFDEAVIDGTSPSGNQAQTPKQDQIKSPQKIIKKTPNMSSFYDRSSPNIESSTLPKVMDRVISPIQTPKNRRISNSEFALQPERQQLSNKILYNTMKSTEDPKMTNDQPYQENATPTTKCLKKERHKEYSNERDKKSYKKLFSKELHKLMMYDLNSKKNDDKGYFEDHTSEQIEELFNLAIFVKEDYMQYIKKINKYLFSMKNHIRSKLSGTSSGPAHNLFKQGNIQQESTTAEKKTIRIQEPLSAEKVAKKNKIPGNLTMKSSRDAEKSNFQNELNPYKVCQTSKSIKKNQPNEKIHNYPLMTDRSATNLIEIERTQNTDTPLLDKTTDKLDFQLDNGQKFKPANMNTSVTSSLLLPKVHPGNSTNKKIISPFINSQIKDEEQRRLFEKESAMDFTIGNNSSINIDKKNSENKIAINSKNKTKSIGNIMGNSPTIKLSKKTFELNYAGEELDFKKSMLPTKPLFNQRSASHRNSRIEGKD